MNDESDQGANPVAPTEYQSPSFPPPVFPDQSPIPALDQPEPRLGRSGVKVTAAVVAVAVTVLAGALVIKLSGSDDSDSPPVASGGTNPENAAETTSPVATPCSTPPSAALTSVRRDRDVFVASVALSSTCDSGDVISSNGMNIVLSSGAATVASARFDFSSRPITIPGNSGSTTLQVIYPPDNFWVLPEFVQPAATAVILTDAGQSSVQKGQAVPQTATNSSISPVAGFVPAGRDPESLSLAGLQTLRQSDDRSVRSDVADRWVPQLSSKQVGLFADGIVWNNREILNEQFDYRSRFPEARLVWSGDWSSFSVDDWWVTVVDLPYPDAAGANAWCDSHGLDKDHCFAKRVTNSSGPEQTTVYRR